MEWGCGGVDSCVVRQENGWVLKVRCFFHPQEKGKVERVLSTLFVIVCLPFTNCLLLCSVETKGKEFIDR
ncbi:hypothetical protein NC652_004738 [Populus alba x Populus x berolinensis]|nr:hypothetical protein NC652_004723 [Populus alba x Populus x berolinensis]KAJ6967273.1 hypothetical protein NC652_004738 [Populus alba x Populus x berolinensis]